MNMICEYPYLLTQSMSVSTYVFSLWHVAHWNDIGTPLIGVLAPIIGISSSAAILPHIPSFVTLTGDDPVLVLFLKFDTTFHIGRINSVLEVDGLNVDVVFHYHTDW